MNSARSLRDKSEGKRLEDKKKSGGEDARKSQNCRVDWVGKDLKDPPVPTGTGSFHTLGTGQDQSWRRPEQLLLCFPFHLPAWRPFLIQLLPPCSFSFLLPAFYFSPVKAIWAQGPLAEPWEQLKEL